MTRIPIAVGLLVAAELAPLPLPAEFTALGRDLVVAGVLFYFYRQLAADFRKLVQDNTAAIQKLVDRLDSVAQCPYVDKERK